MKKKFQIAAICAAGLIAVVLVFFVISQNRKLRSVSDNSAETFYKAYVDTAQSGVVDAYDYVKPMLGKEKAGEFMYRMKDVVQQKIPSSNWRSERYASESYKRYLLDLSIAIDASYQEKFPYLSEGPMREAILNQPEYKKFMAVSAKLDRLESIKGTFLSGQGDEASFNALVELGRMQGELQDIRSRK